MRLESVAVSRAIAGPKIGSGVGGGTKTRSRGVFGKKGDKTYSEWVDTPLLVDLIYRFVQPHDRSASFQIP